MQNLSIGAIQEPKFTQFTLITEYGNFGSPTAPEVLPVLFDDHRLFLSAITMSCHEKYTSGCNWGSMGALFTQF